MAALRSSLRKLLLSSLFLFVLSTATSVFAQSDADASDEEGIMSYIFSYRALTVVLILALVAQILYWRQTRSASRESAVDDAPLLVQKKKKRFDREEMSSLLKASASAQNTPLPLEHASAVGTTSTAGSLSLEKSSPEVEDVSDGDVETAEAASVPEELVPSSEPGDLEGEPVAVAPDGSEADAEK